MVCCILSDNGGEFSNELSRDGVELLVTKTATTAAESLWFNCLVECHNSLIQQIILKIADSSGCSWRRAISAQNVLHGHQGISQMLGYHQLLQITWMHFMQLENCLYNVNPHKKLKLYWITKLEWQQARRIKLERLLTTNATVKKNGGDQLYFLAQTVSKFLSNTEDMSGLSHATSRECIQSHHLISAKILIASKFRSIIPPIIPEVCLLYTKILKVLPVIALKWLMIFRRTCKLKHQIRIIVILLKI